MSRFFVVFSLIAILAPGCSDGGNTAEDLKNACAGLLACSEAFDSMSQCVETTEALHDFDMVSHSYLLTVMGNQHMALLQNMACIAEAGTDCDAVLACMNDGEARVDCSQINTFGSRVCNGDKLVGCNDIGRNHQWIETTVDCAGMGLSCIEIDFDGMGGILPTCGQGMAASTADGLVVECQGDVAQIQMRDGNLQFDCGFYNGDCVAGDFLLYEGLAFCEGKGPECDSDTFADRCDGSTHVWCQAGKEGGMECSQMGQTCTGSGDNVVCGYEACTPLVYQDNCSDGVITYCSAEGEVDLDCKTHGFTGCEPYGQRGARCFP